MSTTIINPKTYLKTKDLLAAGKSFFLVRMPGKAPKLITAYDGPIRAELVGWRRDLSESIKIGDENICSTPPEFPKETSRMRYLAKVGYLIEKLKERGESKTVISRVITGTTPGADWVGIADKLWNAFPNTVGFLFNSPSTGCWLGATPEKLLNVWFPTHYTTMALAGTLNVDDDWNVKVYKEQQMVEKFIENELKPLSTSLSVSKPKDYIFGNIKHLLTHFSGEAKSTAAISDIINTLSPTPALSGFPREDAFADIEDIEDHDRQLYGGYFLIKEGVSPGADWATINAYVMIRCMRFDAATGQWAIYSGGGITNMSDPVAEWEETEKKASRLISIISEYQQ